MDAGTQGTLTARLARIAESGRFEALTLAVIVANAVVLALETFDGIRADAGSLLHTLNDVFLGYFLVELTIRIAAHGQTPQRFFRNGWNVFDFVVIAAAFVPGVRENSTLLRIVRLLRVFRLITVMPELRILLAGLVRSFAPLASMAVMTALLFYVYGMLGWILFEDHDPDNWGSLGVAVLTLFEVLTLEGWIEIADKARELSGWTVLFFVSFVVITSFVLLNMVIAVVITSVEDARAQVAAEERLRAMEEVRREHAEHAAILDRLGELRAAMDGLERELEAQRRVSPA